MNNVKIDRVVYDHIVGNRLVTGYIDKAGRFTATVTNEEGKVIKRSNAALDATLWAERSSGLIMPKPVLVKTGLVIPLVRKFFKV